MRIVNTPPDGKQRVITAEQQNTRNVWHKGKNRGAEKAAHAVAPKTHEPKVEAETNPLIVLGEDTAVISSDAMEKAAETSSEVAEKTDDKKSRSEEKLEAYRTLLEDLERVREMSEGLAKEWRDKLKCLQIAMRIMSGNEVPQEDHRFLMDRDTKLYHRAITLRVEKQDPEELDRLSEDEEEEGNSVEGAPRAEGASETDTPSTDTGETTEAAPVASD